MPAFTVEKKIDIQADKTKVMDVVRDFKQWTIWSPWLTAEPDCPLEFAADGKSYSWDGKIIGSGNITRLAEVDSSFDYDLVFLKPWKSQSKVSFLFDSTADGTQVIWRMQGSLPFFMFWMKKIMMAWVGMDYERGLRSLKDYVERGSIPSQLDFAGRSDGFSGHYLGQKTECAISEMGPRMQQQYPELYKQVAALGRTPKRSFTICHKWDMVNQRAVYTAGVEVDKAIEQAPAGFVAAKLSVPASYKIVHTGAYRHLGSAWSAGMMRARSKTFKQRKGLDPFEVYINDPRTTAEDKLITEVHFPV